MDLLKVLPDLFSILLVSFYFRYLLAFAGQNWIKTVSHTSTLLFLPVITYVITTVITSNIALSLGMVGALSIVRFRNPVRSPLELTIYFASITLGIAAYVNLNWVLFLAIATTLIFAILYLLSKFYKKKLKKSFFEISFGEGIPLSTLEVKVSGNIKILDELIFLKSKKFNTDNNYYLLASNEFNILKKIAKKLEEESNIISYEINQ